MIGGDAKGDCVYLLSFDTPLVVYRYTFDDASSLTGSNRSLWKMTGTAESHHRTALCTTPSSILFFASPWPPTPSISKLLCPPLSRCPARRHLPRRGAWTETGAGCDGGKTDSIECDRQSSQSDCLCACWRPVTLSAIVTRSKVL
jgi:hypothetical protein